MNSDDQLMQGAAEGDRRAFEAIYERYHQDLYRFCLAMVGNPQDAQDAVQNAMVKVLRALPGEERQIRLKSWLYRIARNESIEILRRRPESRALDPEHAIAEGVAETVETRERLRRLLGDLEQLPERQRAVLLMRELSGLDFAEIGAAFGTSAAVARQTLYEARLGLRKLEEGREMRCSEVTRALSDADGRVERRRDIRAHLRSCPSCRAFRDEIADRRQDLAAIAPLPLAASSALLHTALAGKAGGAATAGGGVAGTVAAGAGKTIATSTLVKSIATVAVAGIVGVTAAERSGVIDVPIGRESDRAASKRTPDRRGLGAESAAESAIAPIRAANIRSRRKAHAGALRRDEAVDAADGPRLANPIPVQGENTAAKGNPSRSENGASPPGGGFGRSASERHGRPDELPAAAQHGQQTAAAHKPAKAAALPGRGKPKSESGKPTRGASSPAPGSSTPPGSAKPHPAHPPHPGGEPPPAADGNPPVEPGQLGHGPGSGAG